MASGLTSTATVTKARRLMVATALYVNTHAPKVATLFAHKTLPKGQGLFYREPYWPSIVAGSLAEGVKVGTSTQLSDAATDITPAEIGAQIEVTRRLIETASESVPAVVGKLLGNAMARKQNKDGITTGGTFSSTLGATNQTLSVNLIAAGVAGLEAGIAGTARTGVQPEGDPAPDPYYFITHPYTRFDLAAQLGGVGNNAAVTTAAAVQTFFPAGGIRSGMSEDIIKSGFRLREVEGALVVFDGNVPISSGAITAFLASREGMLSVDFRGMDTDQMWDQQKRTYVWTTTQWYGWAIRVDAWGRAVLLDASPPS